MKAESTACALLLFVVAAGPSCDGDDSSGEDAADAVRDSGEPSDTADSSRDTAEESADSDSGGELDGTTPDDTAGEVDGGDDTDGGGGVVDDVEDGDMSEYAGQMEKFQVRSDDPIAGSHSIQAPDVGSGGEPGTWENGAYNTVASTSGLPRYPEPGDTFRVQIRVDDKDTYGAVLWGVQSDEHPWPGYRLRIDTGASQGIELEKIGTDGPIESHIIDRNAPENVLSDRESGGFNDQFDGDSYDIDPQPNVTYTCTITWKTDGRMPYVCRDPDGNVLGRDDDPKPDREFKGGGIGFMSTQSGNYVEGRGATFDQYEILE